MTERDICSAYSTLYWAAVLFAPQSRSHSAEIRDAMELIYQEAMLCRRDATEPSKQRRNP